jgi:hypothetical protein
MRHLEKVLSEYARNFISSLLRGLALWSTGLLTYLLKEPPIVQPLKNFPPFYGTRRFNTVFTRSLHWFLTCAISIQSTPYHPISLRSSLILSTHVLVLPVVSFLLAFPPISCMHIPFSPIHATFPAHLILHDLIILIVPGKQWSYSLCSFCFPVYV